MGDLKFEKMASGTNFAYAQDGDDILVRDDRAEGKPLIARIGADNQIYVAEGVTLAEVALQEIATFAGPFVFAREMKTPTAPSPAARKRRAPYQTFKTSLPDGAALTFAGQQVGRVTDGLVAIDGRGHAASAASAALRQGLLKLKGKGLIYA